jgi:hypothetical protein
MNIKLHIERLIVEGLPLEWRERQALHGAVEQQLIHLLTARGIPEGLQSASNVAALVAPVLNGGGDTAPQSLGTQIGNSLYAGLASESRREP